MVRKRESGELTKPQQPVVPISRRGPDKEYSRYKQEDFKATGITGSFNIDTRGTNASKSFNSLVAGNKRLVGHKNHTSLIFPGEKDQGATEEYHVLY